MIIKQVKADESLGLLPCPFCGRKPIEYGEMHYDGQHKAILCWIECDGCMMQTRTFTTLNFLAKYWNQRHVHA